MTQIALATRKDKIQVEKMMRRGGSFSITSRAPTTKGIWIEIPQAGNFARILGFFMRMIQVRTPQKPGIPRSHRPD